MACVPRVTRGRGKITRSYVTVQNYANWQEIVIVEQWFKCRGFSPRISGRLLKNSREIADIFNDYETIFSLFIFFYRLRCSVKNIQNSGLNFHSFNLRWSNFYRTVKKKSWIESYSDDLSTTSGLTFGCISMFKNTEKNVKLKILAGLKKCFKKINFKVL